jgi:hypothetical protein
MKRLILNLMQWVKSLFAKKTKKEYEFPEIGTFPVPEIIYDVYPCDEDSQEDKKEIIKEFNKSKKASSESIGDKYFGDDEHVQVLKITVRKNKPSSAYDASKNIEFKCDQGVFNLTSKQHFFLNKIKELANENGNVKANVICKSFIEMKYNGVTESIPEKQFKEDYHKNTFKYLVKQGLIKKFPKGMYKGNSMYKVNFK